MQDSQVKKNTLGNQTLVRIYFIDALVIHAADFFSVGNVTFTVSFNSSSPVI